MYVKCMVSAVPDTGTGPHKQQQLVFSVLFCFFFFFRGRRAGGQILLLQQDSTNCKLTDTVLDEAPRENVEVSLET